MSEKTERLLKMVGEALDEQNADALVVISPENVLYASEIEIVSHRWVPLRLVMVVFHRDAAPTHIICDMQEGFVRSVDGWIQDIRVYPEFAMSPMTLLVDVLKNNGLNYNKVLIEKEFLNAMYYEELKKALPTCEFGDCSHLLDTIRMVKTKDEIAILRENARIVEEALAVTYSAIKPDDSEKDIAAQAISNLTRLGFDSVHFLSLTSRKSVYANVAPSDYVLQRGDMLRIDMIGSRRGYKGDIMRQAVVGRPTEAQESAYQRFVDCLRSTADQVLIGTWPSDLYARAKREFEKANLSLNMPMIGHGLGVGLHEHPSISPLHEAPLVEDMVFNYEPMGVDSEIGGFAQELTIHVTSEGPILLSDYLDISSMYVIDF